MTGKEFKQSDLETITVEERIKRDPRGLGRVTLLEYGVITDKAQPRTSEDPGGPIELLDAIAGSEDLGRAMVARNITSKLLGGEL